MSDAHLAYFHRAAGNRTRGEGTRVSLGVELGGRRNMKIKKEGRPAGGGRVKVGVESWGGAENIKKKRENE